MSIVVKNNFKNSYKWINIIKFFNKNKKFNVNYLFLKKKFNNKIYILYSYYNHTIVQNEVNSLRNILDVRMHKYDLLRFYDIKSINSSTKIHYVLSNIYKIMFGKGYYVKIIQILNSILKSINTVFFDNCFLNHINNLNNELGVDSELYVFKYYNNIMADFYFNNTSNNNLLKQQSAFYKLDLVYFNTSSNVLFMNSNADDDAFIFIKNRNIAIFNIFFKYFFNNINNSYLFNTSFKYKDYYLQNFFYNIYNKDFNVNILSFTKQYFLLLFTNYKKLHYEQYINYLNNFFSINHFLYRIFFKISFVFRLQLKSLSKKMRKILKNKRRYSLSYTYIKPNKRLHVLLHYIKKYILISDGKDLKERLYNTLLPLLLEDSDSWVYQLYAKHQVQCITNIKYRRN